jgi:hypothetical protein
VGLLINDRPNGGDACYVLQNLTNNQILLVADAGAGATPLTGKSVANRQCEVLRNGTIATEDASGVTATFHVRFLPGFRGAKHL